MRVLVIEDDMTLGHALQEFLADQGYAVDWLTDGDRVLGALAGQAYDLLLLDLNLPGRSGLDVLRSDFEELQKQAPEKASAVEKDYQSLMTASKPEDRKTLAANIIAGLE